MKSIRFLLIIHFFSRAIQFAYSQAPIVPVWRQNIKVSLNSINKSSRLRLDGEGNCYVLGTTWFSDSTKDILLIKFNQAGEEQWRRTYDNPSHGDDIPMNMCLDLDGNIWVCGIAKTNKGNADFLVVKFNPDGIPISDQIYDGKNHLFDCASTIVADKRGNIFAAGYETSLDSGINLVIIKYHPDGSFSWRRNFATRDMDVANDLLVDDSSNVYMCGTVNNGPHTADIIVQKYDPEGRKKWQVIYDGVLSQSDAGQFMAADDSMNIYISGFLNHSNNRADIPLIKINRNGHILKDVYYNGHIADCGAYNLSTTRRSVVIVGGCNDYNISNVSSFLIHYDHSCKEKFVLDAPVDVHFMKNDDMGGQPFVFGSLLTHPESTLIPYIAQYDTSSIVWSYADSTVEGLAHITFVAVKGDDIYFLGDDTGDATGTIDIFKYRYTADTEKRHSGVRTPGKLTPKKNK